MNRSYSRFNVMQVLTEFLAKYLQWWKKVSLKFPILNTPREENRLVERPYQSDRPTVIRWWFQERHG